jgi:hypothetical protein
VVPEIKRFLPIGSQFNEGQVELVNGTVGHVLYVLSIHRNKNVRSFPESITLYLGQVTDTLFLSYLSTTTLLWASVIRFRVERHSHSSLMDLTFAPYIWTPFTSMTQHLALSIVCIEALYLFSGMLTVYPVNTGIQSFTHAEFLSLAMAKVWAGKADLPSTTELWRRYDEVVKKRGGYGKHFQYLGGSGTEGNYHFIRLVSLDIDILFP